MVDEVRKTHCQGRSRAFVNCTHGIDSLLPQTQHLLGKRHQRVARRSEHDAGLLAHKELRRNAFFKLFEVGICLTQVTPRCSMRS
jgi:hypothetical protein